MKEKLLQIVALFLVSSSTFFGFSDNALAAWMFNDNGLNVANANLPKSAMEKFNRFRQSINNNNAPAFAAQESDVSLKKLAGGNPPQYQMTLSLRDRATFQILNDQQGNFIVKLLQLGGHT